MPGSLRSELGALEPEVEALIRGGESRGMGDIQAINQLVEDLGSWGPGSLR